jgi:pimeloyl-ACP methyl ester carboxylesterase
MALRLAGMMNDVQVTRTCEYPLEQVRVPTLVVHGAADRFVPFDQHARVLASRIPGAELVAPEGGDHVAIFTHRDMIRPQVVRFLREHAPRAAEDEAPAPV